MSGGEPGTFLSPGAPVDLSNCEREPIHVPGSIQPRGVLLAVSEPDLVVEQVSVNLGELVGVPWDAALGRPLAEAVGRVAAEAVARSASAFGDLRERNPVEITLDVDGDAGAGRRAAAPGGDHPGRSEDVGRTADDQPG